MRHYHSTATGLVAASPATVLTAVEQALGLDIETRRPDTANLTLVVERNRETKEWVCYSVRAERAGSLSRVTVDYDADQVVAAPPEDRAAIGNYARDLLDQIREWFPAPEVELGSL